MLTKDDKRRLVGLVLQLVDEHTELQQPVPQPQVIPLEKVDPEDALKAFVYDLGLKTIANAITSDWRFQSNCPSFLVTEQRPKPFTQWLDEIKPDCISSSIILPWLSVPGVGFKDLIVLVSPYLKRYYDKQLDNMGLVQP